MRKFLFFALLAITCSFAEAQQVLVGSIPQYATGNIAAIDVVTGNPTSSVAISGQGFFSLPVNSGRAYTIQVNPSIGSSFAAFSIAFGPSGATGNIDITSLLAAAIPVPTPTVFPALTVQSSGLNVNMLNYLWPSAQMSGPLCNDGSGQLVWGGCGGSGGGGLSGMTAGQIPVAATATTVTSSKPVSSGTRITTGPGTVVNDDFAKFIGTDGTITDGGSNVGIGAGGTGVTTGLTVLNASNLTSGTVPTARLPIVTVENLFPASGGTINFTHNLNTTNPVTSCQSVSGALPAWPTVQGDANNVPVSMPGAGDVICTFVAAPTSPPAFSFAVTNPPTLYVPTTSTTQTIPLTVTQTALHGFTSNVTYSLSGLPSGITGAFGTNPITGGSGSSTLTMSFPYTQASGGSGFNVLGSGGGVGGNRQVATTIASTMQGVVEAWPANEGSGTTLHTITTSGDNLTTTGVTWGTVTGFPVPVAKFTAGTALGANNTNTNFTGSLPFSISAWVNFTTASATQQDIACNINATPTFTGYCFSEVSGSLQMQLISTLSGGTNLIATHTATGLMANGKTHHVVMTYSGTGLAAGVTFYVDGVVRTTSTLNDTFTTSMANSNPLTLGSTPGGLQPMTGSIAYALIYNRVITAQEVSTLFAAGPQ